MLSSLILAPLVGAIVIAAWHRLGDVGARRLAALVASIPFAIATWAWIRYEPDASGFAYVVDVPWIPTLGVGWRLGVDGISLPLAWMSAGLFTAAASYPVDTRSAPRSYYAWLLFLEAASLGAFLALDLLLFYVCFDLTLVAMYFLIGRWGHGNARDSALQFFLYTFAGSLLMLIAILGLVLASDPLTFDMRVLIERQPLAGSGLLGGFVLLALIVGLGIKTPLVPVHSWLPAAHVDAPGPASAILAGVLLKLGTYGMIRIPYLMLNDAFRAWAYVIAIAAVVSILYGALVAFGQTSLKRRIAYTSINHMGYCVLGIAAAAGLEHGRESARALALTGATVEMVAHGLITGSLFLIAGSFWQRTHEYELEAYGGLAEPAPRLAGATVLAAMASLGLPGLAGFVAEFQIFAGTFAVWPWLAAAALVGVLITAALFLQLLQQLFLGPVRERWKTFPDLGRTEWMVLGGLLALVVAIGVHPAPLLDLIHSSALAAVRGY